MSLKGFHIVFISACLLMFAFMLVWGLVLTEDKDSVAHTMAVSGAMGLLALPFYARYFLKKSTQL